MNSRVQNAILDAEHLTELTLFTSEEIEEAQIVAGPSPALGKEGFQLLVKALKTRIDTPDGDNESWPKGVAFPITDNTRSGIGWIDATHNRGVMTSTFQVGLSEAFTLAEQWMGSLAAVLPRLHPSVKTPPCCEGNSIGLSALIAVLARSLDLEVPQRLAATGCLEATQDSCTITVVDPDSLPGKIEALESLHFDCLLVPIDQQKTASELTNGHRLRVVGVPPSPTHALPIILAEITSGRSSESAILRALALIDRVCVHNPGAVGRSFPDRLLQAVAKDAPSAVQAVVCDLQARRALHEGRTEEAHQQFDRSEEHLKQRGDDCVGHFLAEYFGPHWTSNRAILAIDTGNWDESTATWVELNSEITELENRHDRHDSIRHFLDIHALHNLFACLNTRSFLSLFKARRDNDIAKLQSCTQDRVALRHVWPDLFAHSIAMGNSADSLRRQENYLIDCLCCARTLSTPLPEIAAENLWPSTIGTELPENGYDRIYGWKWHVATGLGEQLPNLYANWIDALEATDSSFLTSSLLELLSLEHPDGSIRSSSTAHLSALNSQGRFNAPDTSILSILQLRTRAVIGLRTDTVSHNDICDTVFSRTNQTSLLTRLAQSILGDSLQDIVYRCPY